MAEFGSKEYYLNREKELSEDLSIQVCALKYVVVKNEKDNCGFIENDIFTICRKISETKDMLEITRERIKEFSEQGE